MFTPVSTTSRPQELRGKTLVLVGTYKVDIDISDLCL